MSSHILAEVDRLATRIGIIHQGRLIEELEAAKMEAIRSRRLIVEARQPAAAYSALEGAGYSVTAEKGGLFITDARALESPDQVATLLVNVGAPPTKLLVEQEDLEAHFMRLTGEKS